MLELFQRFLFFSFLIIQVIKQIQCQSLSNNNIDSISLSDISRVEITSSANDLEEHIIFTPNNEVPEPEPSQNSSFHIKCFDLHRNCREWSLDGECDANPNYMHEKCAYSCNTCSKQSMEFRYEHCTNSWEEQGNPINECYDWANEGYCETNDFMHIYCRRACNYCDFESRCKPNIKRNSSLNLNDYPNPNLYWRLFFNHIISNKWLRWKYGATLVNLDPPVIFFKHLIPEIIADQFIIDNQNENYKLSVDVIGTNDDGSILMSTTQGRSSKNAWCGHECQKHNSTQTVLSAMQEITGIDKTHYEDLQMLIYNKSNYYHYHHDFINSQVNGNAGGRILTLFVYLNDVEMGGETKFPQLKLKVKPSKGSAILWPNVKNNDMTEMEPKTHHTALPVLKGMKYGVNAWIHLYNWVRAVEIDCTS